MAVTSVAWQKSEIPLMHHRAGYDPILGQGGSSDSRQDTYLDNAYTMEPTPEDDDLRVNPPVCVCERFQLLLSCSKSLSLWI